MRSPKRLDGKKKLVAFDAKMEARIKLYCAENNVESESEFIRHAIASFFESKARDETLQLQALRDCQRRINELRDMLTIMFSYLRRAHENLLSYHPEIPDGLKDAAFQSARRRDQRFFEVFTAGLASDPPFFEALLHDYFTGETGKREEQHGAA
jgi:hypothetical protein